MCQSINNFQVNEKAPDFIGATLGGELDFSQWRDDKWVVLFTCTDNFHEHAQTLIQFMSQREQFTRAGVKLLGISNSSAQLLSGWINLLQILTNKAFFFPIINDKDSSIAKLYGFCESEQNLMMKKLLLLIEPSGTIKAAISKPESGFFDFESIHTLIHHCDSNKSEQLLSQCKSQIYCSYPFLSN